MPKKTLKTARGKGRIPTLNAVEISESAKGNIRSITNYLIGQISSMGMSVIVTCSKISKSQYLAFMAKFREIIKGAAE